MEENEPIFDIRKHIQASLQDFKSVLQSMQQVREDLNSTKQAKKQARQDLKRTEKLFSKKLDGFHKKPEFTSTVASQ